MRFLPAQTGVPLNSALCFKSITMGNPMTKTLKSQNVKEERLIEIREVIHGFCEEYLNAELESYAIKLCDNLGRKREINIYRGKIEIWAASIIYAIARLNFLFDKESEKFITADTICDFFDTKKSTIGNKATEIAKACNLTIGAEGYCSKYLTDTFTYYQTPEGFIIPKSMIEDRELVIEVATEKETAEIENYVKNLQKIEEQKEKEKKERKIETNRKIAEQKKKNNIDKNQLSLFDDL